MKTKSLLETADLESEQTRLKILLNDLKAAETCSEKVLLLNEVPEVESFFSKPSMLRTFLAGLSEDCEYVIKSVFAIGQGERLFIDSLEMSDLISRYRTLLTELLSIDTFYQNIGGIVGYQFLVLSFLAKKKGEEEGLFFKPPEGMDLSNEDSLEVRHAIIEGIRNQKNMAEFYPVGGAADRLQLKDSETGGSLPAACLMFQGKDLLEGMVHDLQAREYLYYKFFGEQIVTPLVLMTSRVNQNHDYIQDLCVKNRWFGRSQESFRFITQPSVPVFTKKGEWCLEKPFELLLRPGGHGVIWKLAEDEGVFEWLESLGKGRALVRQINNPIAGVDYGLVAFLGVGHVGCKVFGFASCDRQVDAQEGMVVLKQITTLGEKQVVLTNVEYCDFEKWGIEDKPKKEGSLFSLFPSNTNVLFVDLKEIRKTIQTLPFPGLLVNFRQGSHYTVEGMKEEKIARLETTMQNVADAFCVPLKVKSLPSYVTFNKRRKTISTTKWKGALGRQLLETPEGCFYDCVQNGEELLKSYCRMRFVSLDDESKFLKGRPAVFMNYHPALGPFYSIIRQKIQGGEVVIGSELQLNIADLEIKDLSLKGSLLIVADQLMGHMDGLGILNYSHQTGQCALKNVRIENEGIDRSGEDAFFWNSEIKRKSSLRIHLKGHSFFEAENVSFKGNFEIEVPSGIHMVVTQKGKELHFERRLLGHEKPFWSYKVERDQSIRLNRNS